MSDNERKILLYIPNVIGYIRLVLLLIANVFASFRPDLFVLFYTCSIILDFFDGWAARKFQQTSAFGAWLDVIVDNISRTCLWSSVFQYGWIIISLEWTTFVCNHQAGAKWREVNQVPQKTPEFLQRVMKNGFKTPIGIWVIGGLHILPLWLYVMQNGVLEHLFPFTFSFAVCLVLISGRIYCAACELWCIQSHIQSLLFEDASPKMLKNNN